MINKFDEFIIELSGIPAINLKQKQLKALEDKLDNHDTGVKKLDDEEIEQIEEKIKILKAVIKKLSSKLNEDKPAAVFIKHKFDAMITDMTEDFKSIIDYVENLILAGEVSKSQGQTMKDDLQKSQEKFLKAAKL